MIELEDTSEQEANVLLHQIQNKVRELGELVTKVGSHPATLSKGIKIHCDVATKEMAKAKTRINFSMQMTIPAVNAEVFF